MSATAASTLASEQAVVGSPSVGRARSGESRRRRLRVSRGEICAGSLYALVAVVIAVSLPSGHRLILVAALAAVAGLILDGVVNLPLTVGYASIAQPAFILLLFTAPLNLVPAALGVSFAVAGTIGRRSPRALRRLPVYLSDSWLYIPPVIVLALFAPVLRVGGTGRSTARRSAGSC